MRRNCVLDGVFHHEKRTLQRLFTFSQPRSAMLSAHFFKQRFWKDALTLTLFAIQFLGPPPLAAAVVSLFSEHCDRPGGKNQSRSQSVLFSSHFSFFVASASQLTHEDRELGTLRDSQSRAKHDHEVIGWSGTLRDWRTNIAPNKVRKLGVDELSKLCM